MQVFWGVGVLKAIYWHKRRVFHNAAKEDILGLTENDLAFGNVYTCVTNEMTNPCRNVLWDVPKYYKTGPCNHDKYMSKKIQLNSICAIHFALDQLLVQFACNLQFEMFGTTVNLQESYL